jgi:hypothetical protein
MSIFIKWNSLRETFQLELRETRKRNTEDDIKRFDKKIWVGWEAERVILLVTIFSTLARVENIFVSLT